jgi:hypothetical protein
LVQLLVSCGDDIGFLLSFKAEVKMQTNSPEADEYKNKNQGSSDDPSNASEIGADDDTSKIEDKTEDRNYTDQDSKE